MSIICVSSTDKTVSVLLLHFLPYEYFYSRAGVPVEADGGIAPFVMPFHEFHLHRSFDARVLLVIPYG